MTLNCYCKSWVYFIAPSTAVLHRLCKNMKSSVQAVFTRDDPFPPLPIQKTWYHPSLRQDLTQKKRSTKTSSAVRPGQPASPLSTAEQRQHNGPNRAPGLTCLQTPVDDDHNPTFQEFWPSSTDLESPSSKTTFSSNMDGPSVSTGGFNMSSQFQRRQQDSVLAKYVERFRYGEPSSRAERRPVSSAAREEQAARPFWWMSPSSSSLPSGPTPPHPGHTDDIAPLKDDRGPGSPVEAGALRPYRDLLDISALDLSDSSLGDHGDTEVLQERASRLLQKSQSSVSSGSLVISSEGLGCSDLSSPVTVNEPVRRPFFPSLMESTTYNPSSASPTVGPSQNSTSSLISRQRPEQDILFQWRLRRKMEQARQWPQSLSQQFSSLHPPPSAWQSPRLHQPSVSGCVDHMRCLEQHQQKSIQEPEPSQRTAPFPFPVSRLGSEETHRPCPTAAGTPSASPPCPASSQTASNPQAAMAPLLCDGSPGHSSPPIAQHKMLGRPPDNTTPTHSQPSLKTATDRSLEEEEEEDVGERELCPPPSSSESTKEERSTETKHSQNEKMANRRQKRSMRHHAGDGPGYQKVSCSHHRPSKMVASSPQKLSRGKDKQKQKNSQVLHQQEVCSAQHAPSAPSPIHQALRQAVSEVLFPTRGSSSFSSTRRCTPPAPPRSTGPDAKTQKPAEVVSQLLWETEDSDGDEFEDDALLQVLRNQRTWVKEQISQVDSLLEELQQDGEVD